MPVCWAFGAKVICTNSVKPRAAILANNLAALAGSKEQKAMLDVADNEDIPFCHDSPDGQVMCTKAVRPEVTLLGHDLAEKAGSETDEAMHKAADTEGVGHFTFDQFLAHTKSENSPETLVYFNKYDKNGDGVITLDEMRLDDEEME
ncbi:MAG: hypothetical protein LQ347_001402 [Umbilicaria vellea]|nr:MAG: hypothetical protein LQ347_001402 [Umbilicaria vellea]